MKDSVKKLLVFGALLVSGSLTLAGCLAPASGDSGKDGQQQGGEQEGGQGGQTETTTFPAQALKQFLTSEGVNVTVPSPVSSGEWTYKVEGDEEYGYSFVASVADSGTVGTNSIEDTYTALLQGTSGWTVSDEYYEYIGYVAFKDNVQLCYCTEEGAFNFEAYKYEAAQYEESATFPAVALQSFLTSEGLTTTVPAATGASSWRYAALSDEEGNYFAISAEDNGTPGTNAIEDSYKATLLAAGWEIDDSAYEEYGYYADKGDVEIQFYSYDGKFDMYVYAAEGSGSEGGEGQGGEGQGGEGQGGGDTPVTPTVNDGLTVDTAFTAAEACALARTQKDGEYSTSCYYVKDVVTSVASGFDASFGSLTFNLGEFVAFRLKNGADHDKFTTGDEIKVGDTVIIYGQIVNYVNGDTKTPEMTYSYNNHIEGYVYAINPSDSGQGGEGGGDKISADYDIYKGQSWTTTTDNKSWTIMIYMCGSDLESDNGFATKDIAEILKVTGKPNDVNIIIETGGSTSWKGSYDIPANKLCRWEVSGSSLVKKETLDNASMGETSTFKSFLNWGLTNYPADKVGVIMWNHGGALDGVCYDENYEDYLEASEAKSAFASEIGSNKLEFIGYDACLMQVQDVAEINSSYFNYMVAAEESEAGEGWAYDTWLDDLYAKKDTKTILKEICDTFISEYESTYGVQGYTNDQTLSFLDLSKVAAYKTAFESLASSISSSIATKDFTNLMKNVKNYADTYMDKEDYEDYIASDYYDASMFYTVKEDGVTYYVLHGYYDFGTFDAYDFLQLLKVQTKFDVDETKVNAAISALEQLVVYNAIGDEAGNSNGLALVCPMTALFANKYYPTSETTFTTWRNAVTASGRSY